MSEQSAQQEPVAYRCWNNPQNADGTFDSLRIWVAIKPEGYGNEPLYTSPQPAQQREIEELTAQRDFLADILTRTANALKGQPAELSSHSWHDLPQVAQQLKAAQQQEPVATIRALTDQCAALIQERDELQKQIWRYEKNGVTCQTYRHKVDSTCSECNVQENYTSPQPAQPSKPPPEDYTALEQALTRLQKRYADLEGKASKPLTDDPLQGAVDWLLEADGEHFCTATVQRTLRIGYNRAKRLCDTAKERAAHGIKGDA